MKALTVQQPWAWAIVHGGKLIENRSQLFKYRGPVAIHAGLKWDRGGEENEHVRATFRELVDPQWFGGRLPGWRFPTSVIIGVVDVVDCHYNELGCCAPWGERGYSQRATRGGRRITHLVLENPRPLATPIPCKGALGLWTPPADITERLAAL